MQAKIGSSYYYLISLFVVLGCLLGNPFFVGPKINPAAAAANSPQPGEKATDNSSQSKPYTSVWLAQAEKNIALMEYDPVKINRNDQLAAIGSPEWALANRANNFYATIGTADWQMQFGKKGDNDYTWNFSLQGLSRTGGGQTDFGKIVGDQITKASGTIVINRNGNIQEWYKNSQAGLEQGFSIANKPSGEGQLIITGRIKTNLSASSSPEEIVFSKNKKEVFQYGDVSAFDSRGKKLPAQIAYSSLEGKKQIKLIIDDSQAVYPITIDPLSSSPDWSNDNPNEEPSFGFSVASAGDLNGDGYDDVIVGAPTYLRDYGAVFVYYGSASGFYVYPDWTVSGNQAGEGFGASVASAGDVNGDGYADIIVDASNYATSSLQVGRLYAYYGSAHGLDATSSYTEIGNYNWSVIGDQDMGLFGWSVASAGDINHDGYDDVIVGEPYYNNGSKVWAGKVFVYYGSASGLLTSPAWTKTGDMANETLGISVASAGNVNGDEFSDVIIGAAGYGIGGAAFVYYGSGSGLAATPDWTVLGQSNEGIGGSVASAGDVNGDGYDDVIVGDPYNSQGGLTYNGAAFAYYGSATGLSTTSDWSAYGSQNYEFFGSSVSSAGDVNGDGASDVIVGTAYYNFDVADNLNNGGAVFAYYGNLGSGLDSSPDWSEVYNQPGADDAIVASIGNANGDSYDDVIVGLPDYLNDDSFIGSAFIYYGSANGLSNGVSGAAPDLIMEDNIEFPDYGVSVASAGDVNGDGYGDVIIGSDIFDNYTCSQGTCGNGSMGAAFVFYGSAAGLSTTPDWVAYGPENADSFGNAVASAGDVNGDGYSDVIVGAPYYTNSDGIFSGGAFVYYGSAHGLSASPDVVLAGTKSDVPGGVFGSSWFGSAVGTAGDVNGDGYSDVIVGAPTYPVSPVIDHSGEVLLYYGSASGISPTPSFVIYGKNRGDWTGSTVGTAGDVNGDGYSDIIFHGSQDYHQDTIYVYYGSPSGITTSSKWMYESNELETSLGNSVSSAGDVNGDGFDDIVVGEPFNNGGYDQPGSVLVFYGSANGLSASPDWTVNGTQDGDVYGGTVSLAGDVNNDGYADIVVSNQDLLGDWSTDTNGLIDVYYGGPAGLSAQPDWSVVSDQTTSVIPGVFNEFFGQSVTTAGDIKGNNVSNLIAGAPGFGLKDSGGNYYAYSGKILVYYDSTTTDENLIPGQLDYKKNNVALGGTISTSTFAIALTGKAPVGRTEVKTWYELKPVGVPFDGTGLVESTNWINTGLKGGTVTTTISGLQNNHNYHWRARWQYLPSMDFTPWYTVGTNNANEVDIATVFSENLLYSPGANGSLAGSAAQSVLLGGNGSAVTAVPDSGYQFLQWSDGSTANPRTDSAVTKNISVIAEFSALPPAPAPGGGGGYVTPAPANLNLNVSLSGGAANVPLTAGGAANQINISNPQVKFDLNLSGVSYYSVAHTSDFANRSYLPYSPEISFTLPDQSGSYPIYLKFRLANGTDSQVYYLLFNLNESTTAPASTGSAAPASPASASPTPLPKTAPALSAKQIKQIISHVAGDILLQVQGRGEAWYVDPLSQQRIFLSDGSAVNNLIHSFGLGVSNANLAKLQAGNRSLINRLKGRIILAVQDRGQAYYLNPRDGKIYFLGSGTSALKILVSLGLGISNSDLGALTARIIR
jgi:Divergent InlB B-repeat domain/FG-GAP repeat/FG-GAP-like repeat